MTTGLFGIFCWNGKIVASWGFILLQKHCQQGLWSEHFIVGPKIDLLAVLGWSVSYYYYHCCRRFQRSRCNQSNKPIWRHSQGHAVKMTRSRDSWSSIDDVGFMRLVFIAPSNQPNPSITIRDAAAAGKSCCDTLWYWSTTDWLTVDTLQCWRTAAVKRGAKQTKTRCRQQANSLPPFHVQTKTITSACHVKNCHCPANPI